MAPPRLKPWQRGRSRNTGDMPYVHSVDWMVGRLVETRFHLTLTKTLALALALAPIGPGPSPGPDWPLRPRVEVHSGC